MMAGKEFKPGAVTYEGDLSSNYPRARMLSADTADTWAGVLRPFLTMFDRPIVLDLGCGTGRFSTLIADRFGATVVGLDSSLAMLQAAMGHSGAGKVQYAAGQAERLPLAESSCDVVWMSQVAHHIRDRQACAAALHRALRSHGVVLIRGTFGDWLEGFPTFFEFFPGARQLTASFPTVGELSAVFEAEGFSLESMRRVQQKTCQSLRELAIRTKLRADSTLVLLADAEFEAGQTVLEEAASHERVPSPIIETLDLLVLRRS